MDTLEDVSINRGKMAETEPESLTETVFLQQEECRTNCDLLVFVLFQKAIEHLLHGIERPRQAYASFSIMNYFERLFV